MEKKAITFNNWFMSTSRSMSARAAIGRQMAQTLGVSYDHLKHILRDKRRPSVDLAHGIVNFSEGFSGKEKAVDISTLLKPTE